MGSSNLALSGRSPTKILRPILRGYGANGYEKNQPSSSGWYFRHGRDVVIQRMNEVAIPETRCG